MVPADPRVLVFTKTTGYRHASIAAGVAALADAFTIDATEDAAVFTPENLARYGVVVFLNTSGNVLDDEHRRALAAYLAGGGGFVGVHCAAGTENDWPAYDELIGARFDRHPEVQPAVLHVADRDHPATAHLSKTWEHVDEWYDFRTNPRPHVRVLLTVDESTYAGGGMGDDHPIAWCRPYGQGRSFYTALGHTIEAYADPAVRAHLAGAIRWAAGQD
jgi:hypothetical protein